ncbi:MAG: 3-oxoacyl-ACP synthase III [Waddliaceae bacterium]|nr:3-oxoacyl-ACP synthase III [Waddliaceae bacterium]
MFKLAKFEQVSIAGVSSVDAPERISTEEIEDLLKEPMERVYMRRGFMSKHVGIEERRLWPRGTTPSQAATLAAEKVIEETGIDPSRIGVLINTSVTKDYVEPSCASIVHSNLRLSPYCMNFDVSNACMGFLNGMHLVGSLIEGGQIDYGLVVNGEDSRTLMESTIQRLQGPDIGAKEFRKHFATLTLGSGAAAMIIGRSDLLPDSSRFLGGMHLAATEHYKLCHGSTTAMYTDPTRLFRAGIDLVMRLINEAKQAVKWNPASYKELVLHQINRLHTNTFLDRIGYAHDRIFRIYPKYGNVGPATIPISLAKSLAAGRLNKGDRVSLVGVGSGLNSAIFDIVC